jgi:hypothetical protein
VKIVETNVFMWLIRCPLNAFGNFLLASLPLGKLEDYKGTPCNDSIKNEIP